jgi:hypothetical protein
LNYEQALEQLGLNPDIRLRQMFELGRLAAPVQQKPLFADIIAKHPGLAEELKAMDESQPTPVQKQVLGFDVVLDESLPPNTMKFVQPAVPDAITDNSESPEYKSGWNECRELTIKMRTP